MQILVSFSTVLRFVVWLVVVVVVAASLLAGQSGDEPAGPGDAVSTPPPALVG